MTSPRLPTPRVPVFVMIFVSVFGFIGLTVLIFLWSGSSDGFGSPPLIFKLFGSFIAIAFMAFGFGLPITAWRHRMKDPLPSPPPGQGLDGTESQPPEGQGYRCPHCGAGLEKQEVSPRGDVKCIYCRKWWNIHQGHSP